MRENPGLRTNLRGHVIPVSVSTCLLLAAFAAFGQIEAPVRPPAATTQAPQKTGFRAVSYEVFASLAPETQMLTARAIVEFEAQSPSRAVECELHPNLSLSDVRDAAGKVLEIDRGGQNGLDVVVTLPDVVRAGQRTKLTFSYSGVLANEENSAISGVRLASIGKDGAYLLLPARWFPLTGYPCYGADCCRVSCRHASIQARQTNIGAISFLAAAIILAHCHRWVRARCAGS